MAACPCGDPRCSTEMPCRSRGQPVRMCRLQSKPELNGREATALAFDLASSRYVIKLSGVPTRVLLKADNLLEPSTEFDLTGIRRIALDAAKPKRFSIDVLYDLERLHIYPKKIKRLPGESGTKVLATELLMVLQCDESHSGEQHLWTNSDGALQWMPQSPLGIFLTGPYCTVDPSAVASLRSFFQSSCDPTIDYPPPEMLLSCPGCNCCQTDGQTVFLSLQYFTCRRRRAGVTQTLETFNKVLPRYWCLACVRDVILPTAPSSNVDEPWAHERISLVDVSRYSILTAMVAWQEEDGRPHPLAPPDRMHTLDHFYYTMARLGTKVTGGVITGDPRESGNNRIVSSCNHCAIAYRMPWALDDNGGAGMPKLKHCAGCQTVAYCSKECQKADWPSHKAACKEARRVGPRHERGLDYSELSMLSSGLG